LSGISVNTGDSKAQGSQSNCEPAISTSCVKDASPRRDPEEGKCFCGVVLCLLGSEIALVKVMINLSECRLMNHDVNSLEK
jgi:hypothetical protein